MAVAAATSVYRTFYGVAQRRRSVTIGNHWLTARRFKTGTHSAVHSDPIAHYRKRANAYPSPPSFRFDTVHRHHYNIAVIDIIIITVMMIIILSRFLRTRAALLPTAITTTLRLATTTTSAAAAAVIP